MQKYADLKRPVDRLLGLCSPIAHRRLHGNGSSLETIIMTQVNLVKSYIYMART